jgi:hypothetical protein
VGIVFFLQAEKGAAMSEKRRKLIDRNSREAIDRNPDKW